MSEEYVDCILRPKADEAVTKVTRELCHALIDTDTMDILNVYSPGTFWTKVIEGARHFECGYGSVVCDVSYQVLPLYKMYKLNSDLTTGESSQRPAIKPTDFSQFKEMNIASLAKRKFVSISTTTFLGVKTDDEIVKVFPRATPVGQISNLAAILPGDIVMVKAKANYELTELARVEKTYDQLRQS